MRLVDLLRSRSHAADAGNASGAGYLRDQDVSSLFEDNMTGKKKRKVGSRHSKSHYRTDASSVGIMKSGKSGMSGESGSAAHREDGWPDDPLEAFVDTPEFQESDAIYKEMLGIMTQIYGEGEHGELLSIDIMTEPVNRMIDVCKKTDMILRKAIRLKPGAISFPQHSLDTAITAIKTGLALGYNDNRLVSLAFCALLGDIGMTRIDQNILSKTGKLSSDEFTMIKYHVDDSVDILSHFDDRYPYLTSVVGQIHERENGSGYPNGLKGSEIHEYARIIGMCDVYTALTEPRVNREKYSGFVALQQIISRRGEDFGRAMIKSLIEAIGIFPLESLVKLNNGLIGRVIGISRIHPTRPLLNVLVDADGLRLPEPRLLDLEQEQLLYIEDPDIEEGAVLNA